MNDLPRFFSSSLDEGARIALSKEESAHGKVLRLSEGDAVHVVDGAGSLAEATIVNAGKHMELSIGAITKAEPRERQLHLAVAPTKNIARYEWIVEKATELGVASILPIQCEHSERVRIKTERLERIALSAMKQSKNLWMPRIEALMPFAYCLQREAEHKYIAHCLDTERAAIHSLQGLKNGLVMIGPEGDFSEAEIALAVDHGFTALSLGDLRLRTETAAITVCIAANLL